MEHGGGHEIGAHKILELAGMQFHLDTLIMTWIAMACVIVVVIAGTRKLSLVPGGTQNFVEMLLEPILNQIDASVGKKGQRIIPIVVTVFLFVLFSNMVGLLPGMASPTADINTTFGLAILVISLVHIYGVADKGLKYFAHFFQPNPFFILLHIMDNLSRPLTMAFRLFGNIISHEILMIVLLALVPFIVPTGILFLGLFIGLIQAAIFTILSITYLAEGLRDEH
jgi:F-type H+-transporting ATPase subunit a